MTTPVVTQLLNGMFHAGRVKIGGVEYGATGISPGDALEKLAILIKREVPNSALYLQLHEMQTRNHRISEDGG